MTAFGCNSHIACLAELLQLVTYFQWSRLFYNSARHVTAKKKKTNKTSVFHLLACHCAKIPGKKNLASQSESQMFITRDVTC